MDKIKQNYDRVLLIVVALITLVACSMLIMKSFAVGQNYPGVDEGNGKDFDDPASDKVAEAMALVETTQEWKPVKDTDSEKAFRLMASIPIVMRADDDTEINLYSESEQLREGISNKYILDHNLPYRRSDVASLDLDGDGFSNQEEFELGGTNPRDGNDYPDATHKLREVAFTSEPYIVVLNSVIGDKDFSIKRVTPAGAPRLPRELTWSHWKKVGEKFPDSGADANRFEILSFGKKEVVNAATGKVTPDASVLTVKDTTTGEEIELVRSARTDIPVHRVTFSYTGPGAGAGGTDFGGKMFVKGDSFKLPGTDITIKVLKVSADQAELEATPEGKNPKILLRPEKNL